MAKLAQELGIANLLPAAGDPLGALQVETKTQQGIDLAGEMAFVMLDPAVAGGDPERSLLILVPISDYPAFLANWPGAAAQEGVTEVKLGDTNEPGFVANWGKYAVIAPSRELVAKKPAAGIKAPSVTAKQLTERDMILYANFDALRSKLTPGLQMGRTQISQEVERGFAGNPQMARFAPVVKTIVNQMFNAVDRFVADAQATSVGMSFAPEGISATVVAEFKPDSYLATNLASIKNSDAPMMNGLPEAKYLAYGGSTIDPAAANKLVSDIVDPVVQELMKIGPEMAPAKDYVDALKAYITASRSQSFGMVAPNGPIGTQALFQMVAVQTGDAPAMVAAYTKMMQAQTSMMKALVPNAAGLPMPTYTQGGKTVDGVKFDQITTKLDPAANNAAAMQQAQALQMMYGPEGMVMNYGVLDPTHMLAASGVPDSLISSAIAAAKANRTTVADAESLKGVKSQLPKQRLMEMYFSVGEFATTGLNYARQLGLTIPVQLAPDLPPIGMTAATENNTALRIDVHVPTTLVQSLIAAGMQAQMQMQGGGPGAGGGL
jgi:hypothetical protein